MKMLINWFRVSIILFVVTGSISNVFAQGTTIPLQCGDIINSETTTNEPVQNWMLNVQAGTVINLYLQPMGESFNVSFALLDAGGSRLEGVNENPAGSIEQLVEYRLGSSKPIVRVGGQASRVTYFSSLDLPRYLGAYTISLGCILLDGTVINPGDILQSSPSLEEIPTSSFSGYGFPGLAPIDFANIAKIPLIANTPMTGAVTPTGGEILGYTLDANGGDKLDLSFTRLSGNLNLGLVVLSAENQVVFQASLVTSEIMSSRFTLPTAGQYTIGVFRIDLLPPAAPEATAFQVQGTLNP